MTTGEILDEVLRREGGYVDHPHDRGGPTHYGITRATLAGWRKAAVTAEDVQRLTEAEARAIYQRQYVEAPGFDQIVDPRLRALLVDYGVHSGPRRAIMDLQRAAGVTVDGTIGPQTLAAVDLAGFDLPVLAPSDEELAAHEAMLADVDEASHGQTVWRRELA